MSFKSQYYYIKHPGTMKTPQFSMQVKFSWPTVVEVDSKGSSFNNNNSKE